MSQTQPSTTVITSTLQCNGQDDQNPVFIKKQSTKDYSDTTRVYDADGLRLRSDAICFSDKDKSKVLLVSSRNWLGQWTIPGGGLEPNETMEQTALREAMEEAGVEGTLHEFVGSFENRPKRTRTKVFTMIVSKEVQTWKDEKQIDRKRKWFTKEEAVSMLKLRCPTKCRYLEAACFGTTNMLIHPIASNGGTPIVRTNYSSPTSSDPIVDGVSVNSDLVNNSVHCIHGNSSCRDPCSENRCNEDWT